MLAAFSFWSVIPAKPPAAYWILFAIPASVPIFGSWWLWRKRRPRKDDQVVPMAGWAKTAWALSIYAGVFLSGYYVGGGTESGSPLEIMPSALAGLPPEKLEVQVRADFDRLKTVSTGLEELLK